MYSQISERIWYDGGSQSGSFTIVLVCVVMYSWWNAKLLPREFSLIFVLLVHVTKWSNQIALLLSYSTKRVYTFTTSKQTSPLF